MKNSHKPRQYSTIGHSIKNFMHDNSRGFFIIRNNGLLIAYKTSFIIAMMRKRSRMRCKYILSKVKRV